MDQIRSLLKIAAKRLELSRFLGIAHWVFLGLAILAVLLVPGERLGAATFVPWAWVAPVLIGLGLVVSIAFWARGRLNDHQVAVEVDTRLDLREKLSTALHCRRDEDPFARAAVEDAVKVAGDARTRERVRRQFGVTAPVNWWISPLLILVAGMLSYIKPLDLFSEDTIEDGTTTDMVSTTVEENPIDPIVEQIKDNPALEQELSDLLEEFEQGPLDPDDLQSAEDIRRDAIKNLSELNEKLEEIIDGEKGMTAEALESTFERLETPAEGPAKEFAEALKAGNFQQASKELQELLDDLANGEMDPEQAEELAAQLEDLAEQLQELAKQQQELEDALKEAGLDPQLAQNPQAMQEAIDKAQNMNEQQKQQLQQMAQAQQAAQQMCKGLGQMCQGMAQQMQQGGNPGQMGQQMAGQLNDMEQLQQLMQQAQAMANACKNGGQCMGQGLAMQQIWEQSGGAFGNRGQSSGGGKAPIAPTPWKPTMTKADVHTTAGDIIARMEVDGPVMVGETTKVASRVVTDVVDAYEEAIAEDPLPRKYQDAQKHYFGRWESQVRDRQTGSQPPAEGGKTEGE